MRKPLSILLGRKKYAELKSTVSTHTAGDLEALRLAFFSFKSADVFLESWGIDAGIKRVAAFVIVKRLEALLAGG